MLNEREEKIILLLKKKGECIFSDMLKSINASREPLHRSLLHLLKLGLIKRRKLGNLFIYSLNSSSQLLYPLLSLIDQKIAMESNENAVIREFVDIVASDSVFSLLYTTPKDVAIKFFVICLFNTNDVARKAELARRRFIYKYKLKTTYQVKHIDEVDEGDTSSLIREFVTIFNGEPFYRKFLPLAISR